MKRQQSAGDSQSRPDEDTEAILSRRQFLIASSLVGAGIGFAATGCRPKPENAFPGYPFFQPCLSIAKPRPKPEPPEPGQQGPYDPPVVGPEPADRFEEFEPEWEDQTGAPKTEQPQEPRRPEDCQIPQVCLHVMRGQTAAPQVCLSVPANQGRHLPPVE